MSKIANRRILKDIEEFHKINSAGEEEEMKIRILDENNLFELEGEIKGPKDTPYSKGIYKLKILLPETYPFNPPKIKFITKIWHPNISSVTGTICLDILGEQWAAALSLRTILISLKLLLSSPVYDDPIDAVVSKQYKNNPLLFHETAKFWTTYYANANLPMNQEFFKKINKVKKLTMTTQENAIVLLSLKNWSVKQAVNDFFEK